MRRSPPFLRCAVAAASLAVVVVVAGCPAAEGEGEGEGDGAEGEGEGEPAIDRAPCVSDEDCADELRCSNIAQGDFIDHCTTTCAVDGDCAVVDDGFAYACVARSGDGLGICARTCDAPDQCGDIGLCFGGTGVVDGGLCVDPPGGVCGSDNDCPADTSCKAIPSDIEWGAACGPLSILGALRTGDTCDPAAQSAGNLAGLCASHSCDPHGRCRGACEADEDCPDASFTCQGAPQPQPADVVHFCVVGTNVGDPCARDADCAGGDVCAVVATLDGVTQEICRPPLDGDLPAGSACASPPAPCASAFCHSGACAALCASDADCTAPQTCVSFTGGGGGILRACADP